MLHFFPNISQDTYEGFETKLDKSRKIERYRVGQKPKQCIGVDVDDAGQLGAFSIQKGDSRLTRLSMVNTVASCPSSSLAMSSSKTTSGTVRRRYVATVIENNGDEVEDKDYERRRGGKQGIRNEILEDSKDSFNDQNFDQFMEDVAARRIRVKQKMISQTSCTCGQVDVSVSDPEPSIERMGSMRKVSESSDFDSDFDASTSSEEDVIMKPVFVPKFGRLFSQDEQANVEADRCATLTTMNEQEQKKKLTRKLLAASTVIVNNEYLVSKDDDIPDDNDESHYDEDFTGWKIRELNRLKRLTEEREMRLGEMVKLSKRRNMTDGNIMKEDKMNGSLKIQKSNRKFMQKYYHKGAFYMDEASLSKDENDVRNKVYDGVTGEDNFNFEALPKVLQVKNFGKRGRTKYTHLMDQDTTGNDDHILQFSVKKS